MDYWDTCTAGTQRIIPKLNAKGYTIDTPENGLVTIERTDLVSRRILIRKGDEATTRILKIGTAWSLRSGARVKIEAGMGKFRKTATNVTNAANAMQMALLHPIQPTTRGATHIMIGFYGKTVATGKPVVGAVDTTIAQAYPRLWDALKPEWRVGGVRWSTPGRSSADLVDGLSKTTAFGAPPYQWQIGPQELQMMGIWIVDTPMDPVTEAIIHKIENQDDDPEPAAAAAKPPAHTCCKPGCGAGASKVCSRCKKAWYCTPGHQKEDWKRHKKECVPKKEGTKMRTTTASPTYALHCFE